MLTECSARKLEGIVSKRKDAPYRSGKCDWIKVKCGAWREDNRERWRMFEHASVPSPTQDFGTLGPTNFLIEFNGP